MGRWICTKCDGHGMIGPLDDPDACFDCGGMGYYDDGYDDTEGDFDRRQKHYASMTTSKKEE